MRDMFEGPSLEHGERLRYARAPSGSWWFPQQTSLFQFQNYVGGAVGKCMSRRLAALLTLSV